MRRSRRSSRAECGVIVLLHRPESAAELLERAQPGAIAAPQKNALRNYGIGAQILRDLKVSENAAAGEAASNAEHGGIRSCK